MPQRAGSFLRNKVKSLLSRYQERQKTTGIEINVGKTGISIEKK